MLLPMRLISWLQLNPDCTKLEALKDLIENIRELARELRLLQKISLGTLAKRIDRSPAFLSQLERNISKPLLKDIYAIAGVRNRRNDLGSVANAFRGSIF